MRAISLKYTLQYSQIDRSVAIKSCNFKELYPPPKKSVITRKYQHKFDFKICKIIEFLQEIRVSQSL